MVLPCDAIGRLEGEIERRIDGGIDGEIVGGIEGGSGVKSDTLKTTEIQNSEVRL
jgi:hypothetical protein